jgi:two-component system, OmpR family, osmolarity sensor histidine kinase EnvZ
MAARFDSLFTRLLLAQVGLVIALSVVVGGLFYVERNVTMAELYADLWAPQLARAAGLKAEAPEPAPLLRREVLPERTRRPASFTPRFNALKRQLVARGVPVDDLRLGLDGAEPMVWLHVQPPDRGGVWLGVAGQMIVPEWSARAIVALVLIGGVMVWISWAFTRRLTRPLEALRARMQTHVPGRSIAVGAGDAAVPGASPEVAAIDAAYADLLARIERHERERAVLLAGVSHDLRSPLGRIAMAADLLPDEPALQPRKASIARNVREADRRIESFLDYVRAGELAFDETVDLGAAARSVVAAFERPASELSFDAPAAPVLRANANRLLVERLLANLIDNAIKHGRPPVRVRLGGNAAQAWIEILDDGPGIDPLRAESLQEAFTRSDPSRSVPGTGLGLAIVRQVATRLGGSVSFDREGASSRVRVMLGAA